MEYCAYCGNPVEKATFAPCPKCGNPANGAPRPAAPPRGSNTAVVVVIVVVVVLAVVAVLGILSAIAVPNLLTAIQRSKQQRTMADVRTIATAAEAYSSDENQYPESLNVLAPKYVKVVPTLEGWGHPVQYECVAGERGKCSGYMIVSAGKDGRLESNLDELLTRSGRATTNFDCDIVYSNGNFLEYPEGVQH